MKFWKYTYKQCALDTSLRRDETKKLCCHYIFVIYSYRTMADMS